VIEKSLTVSNTISLSIFNAANEVGSPTAPAWMILVKSSPDVILSVPLCGVPSNITPIVEGDGSTPVRGALYEPAALLRVCRAKIESRNDYFSLDDAFFSPSRSCHLAVPTTDDDAYIKQ
jgi:hypothetical protein